MQGGSIWTLLCVFIDWFKESPSDKSLLLKAYLSEDLGGFIWTLLCVFIDSKNTHLIILVNPVDV